MRKNVFIFDDRIKLDSFLIEKWIKIGEDSIKDHGFFSVALSGGETPKPFYKKLFDKTDSSIANIWQNSYLFVVDERYVDISDSNSNSGTIKKIINGRSINFFPIDCSFALEEAALDYEGKIIDFFSKNKRNVSFDFILLGIGKDGHTASIFPGDDFFIDNNLISTVVKEKNGYKRITMTLNLINRSKKIFFLVTGEDKAEIVKNVIQGKEDYPACKVSPLEGELFFVLDRDAAKLL